MNNNEITVLCCIKTELKKIFMSFDLYSSIVINLVILGFAFYCREYTIGFTGGMKGVSYEFFYEFDVDLLPELIILVSALPVAGIFFNEWNSGYTKFVASRTGIKNYLYSKVIACIIGATFTAFISQLIISIIMNTQMPMTGIDGVDYLSSTYPFGGLVGYPYMFHFIKIFCFSIFCSIWACLGLMISAYVPNKYVVYTSSYIGFYVVEQIFNNKIDNYVPNFLSVTYMSRISLVSPLFGNELFDFIYINALFIVISLILGLLFVKRASRRMRYE